jgi:phosphotransferase system HPr (HPr) family protein
MTEIILPVTNEVGLHARPAALFYRKARSFKSKITIQNLSKTASIELDVTPVNLLQADITKGHQIRLRADGPDEAEALAALKDLIENNFGE